MEEKSRHESAADWAKDEKGYKYEGEEKLESGDPDTPYEFIYGVKDPYEEKKPEAEEEPKAEEKPKVNEAPKVNKAPEPHFFSYVDAKPEEFDRPNIPSVAPIIGQREADVMNGSGSPEFEALKASFGKYQENLASHANENDPKSRKVTYHLFVSAFHYLRRKDTDPTLPGGQERVRAAAAIMADAGMQVLETCSRLMERDVILKWMKVECMRNQEFRNNLTSTRLLEMAHADIEGKRNVNSPSAVELYSFAVVVSGVCRNKGENILFPGKMDSEYVDDDKNYQAALAEIEKLSPIAADLRKEMESCHTAPEIAPKVEAMANRLQAIGPDDYLRLRKEKELYGNETFDARSANLKEGFVPECPDNLHVFIGRDDNLIMRGTGSPEFNDFAAAYNDFHSAEDVDKPFQRDKAKALFSASFEYLRRKDTTPTFGTGKQRVAAGVRAMATTGLDLLETCDDPEEGRALLSAMKIECQRNQLFRNYLLDHLPEIVQSENRGMRNANYPAALELYSFALVVSGICQKTGKEALVEGKMDGDRMENSSRYRRAMQNISDFETTAKHIAGKLRRNLDDKATFRSLSEQFRTHIGGNGLKKEQPARQMEQPHINVPNAGN